MELNYHHEAEIQYPCHCLTQYLNQPDAAEISVPFWYQDNGLPGVRFSKVTLANGDLDQTNDYLPLRGVHKFLPSGFSQTGTKVLLFRDGQES